MWRMILLVYIGALILALYPFKCFAFEYDVEWPISDGKKQTSTIVITIDNCKTSITMKNSDIEQFSKKENLEKAIKLALERAKNGCKN